MNYPSAISIPFLAIEKEENYFKKLLSIRDTFQGILNILAEVLLSEYKNSGIQDNQLDELIQKITKPTEGDLVKFVVTAISLLEKSKYPLFMNELIPFMNEVHFKTKTYYTIGEDVEEHFKIIHKERKVAVFEFLLFFRNKELAVSHANPMKFRSKPEISKILFEKYFPALEYLVRKLKFLEEYCFFLRQGKDLLALQGEKPEIIKGDQSGYPDTPSFVANSLNGAFTLYPFAEHLAYINYFPSSKEELHHQETSVSAGFVKLNADIFTTWPYMIAHSWRVMTEETEPQMKLVLLKDNFFNALKYITLITASEYFNSDIINKDLTLLFRDKMGKAIMGNWAYFLYVAITVLKENNHKFFVPELVKFLEATEYSKNEGKYKNVIKSAGGVLKDVFNSNATALNSLIWMRNTFMGHSSGLEDAKAIQIYDLFYPVLAELLTGLSFLSRYPLIKYESGKEYILMGVQFTEKLSDLKKVDADQTLWIQNLKGDKLHLLPFYIVPRQFMVGIEEEDVIMVYESNTGKRITFFSPVGSEKEYAGVILEKLNLLVKAKLEEERITEDQLDQTLLRKKLKEASQYHMTSLIQERKVIGSGDKMLYQPRVEPEAVLKSFIGVRYPILFISALAGSGKTNLLYTINGEYTKRNIDTLFLRGSRLNTESLLDAIKNELNLSEQFDVKNSIAFAYTQEKPLIILIDGCNEHSQSQRFFVSILAFASDFPDGRIKIVVTWRINTDQDYPIVPEGMEELIYNAGNKSGTVPSEDSRKNMLKKNAMILTGFDRREMESAWTFFSRYQEGNEFLYKPKFSLSELTLRDRPLSDLLANPLYMRLYMEVNNGKKLPAIEMGFASIWEPWYEWIENKITGTKHFLEAFANALIESGKDSLELDYIYRHPLLKEYVRDYSAMSVYQQLLRNGVIAEYFIDGLPYVSFAVEAAFHYVGAEVLSKNESLNDYDEFIAFVNKSPLKAIKAISSYCLLKDLQNGAMERITYLIDNENFDLDILTVPLAQAIMVKGSDLVVKELLANPTSRDWKVLENAIGYIEDAQAQIIIPELAIALYKPLARSNYDAINLSLKILDYLEYKKAEKLFEHISLFLKYLKKIDEEEKLKLYNGLASFFENASKFDFALKYYNKILAIRLLSLGDEHPDVAKSYYCIGGIWYEKGNFTKALKYYEKCLSIELKTFGPTNPVISKTYIAIGMVWHNKGNYDKAIEYFENALSVDLRNLGMVHADIAGIYNNIGGAWHLKENYDKALEYYEKCLEMAIKIFGEYHTDIAGYCVNIAGIYCEKGENNKAIEFAEKSLNIFLEKFGPYNPNVALAYDQIGDAWANKGEYDKTLESYEKSLAIRLKIFGESHLDVGFSYDKIETIWENKGDYEKALEYNKKSLTIKLKTLGKRHPDIAACYSKIGLYLLNQNQFNEAIDYYTLGFSITKSGGYPFQIAKCYEELNEKEKALSSYITSAKKRIERLGLENELSQNSIKEIIRLANDLDEQKTIIRWSKKLI
jgi:tetratricopeptide (TPR) repeat protein